LDIDLVAGSKSGGGGTPLAVIVVIVLLVIIAGLVGLVRRQRNQPTAWMADTVQNPADPLQYRLATDKTTNPVYIPEVYGAGEEDVYGGDSVYGDTAGAAATVLNQIFVSNDNKSDPWLDGADYRANADGPTYAARSSSDGGAEYAEVAGGGLPGGGLRTVNNVMYGDVSDDGPTYAASDGAEYEVLTAAGSSPHNGMHGALAADEPFELEDEFVDNDGGMRRVKSVYNDAGMYDNNDSAGSARAESVYYEAEPVPNNQENVYDEAEPVPVHKMSIAASGVVAERADDGYNVVKPVKANTPTKKTTHVSEDVYGFSGASNPAAENVYYEAEPQEEHAEYETMESGNLVPTAGVGADYAEVAAAVTTEGLYSEADPNQTSVYDKFGGPRGFGRRVGASVYGFDDSHDEKQTAETSFGSDFGPNEGGGASTDADVELVANPLYESGAFSEQVSGFNGFDVGDDDADQDSDGYLAVGDDTYGDIGGDGEEGWGDVGGSDLPTYAEGAADPVPDDGDEHQLGVNGLPVQGEGDGFKFRGRRNSFC
jgi:hypothetical protein